MGEGKSQDWLVWGVLGLMLAAGVAALALAPGNPDGSGPPGQNRAPSARMHPANATVNLGDTVEFSGANSTDPDGSLQSFAWDFGDGSTGTGAIVSHEYQVTGALRVKLEVTDDRGAKNATTTNLWVNLNEALPPGVASWNQYTGNFPFNASFPVDPSATRIVASLQLNTSSFLGATAVVTLQDPNGAEVYAGNVSLAFGQFPSALSITIARENITVEGTWTLRVDARAAVGGQPSASVTVTGTVRVEYKP